tara:strand:+ start:394 stop:531 length:138 start_codon:yes stop_codon:yes gene_type:complete
MIEVCAHSGITDGQIKMMGGIVLKKEKRERTLGGEKKHSRTKKNE